MVSGVQFIKRCRELAIQYSFNRVPFPLQEASVDKKHVKVLAKAGNLAEIEKLYGAKWVKKAKDYLAKRAAGDDGDGGQDDNEEVGLQFCLSLRCEVNILSSTLDGLDIFVNTNRKLTDIFLCLSTAGRTGCFSCCK
jgi:hypothetical protein